MATYARITLTEKGKKPFYLQVTKESATFLYGIEVDKEGEDVMPRGFHQRLCIIDKLAIKKRVPMVMSLKYCWLEPIKKEV